MKHKKHKPPLKKNYFYVVYSLDLAALPIAYCETLEELARFFNRPKITLTNLLAHHRYNKKYPNEPIKNYDGKLYAVGYWHIKNKNGDIEQVYKIGGGV